MLLALAARIRAHLDTIADQLRRHGDKGASEVGYAVLAAGGFLLAMLIYGAVSGVIDEQMAKLGK